MLLLCSDRKGSQSTSDYPSTPSTYRGKERKKNRYKYIPKVTEIHHVNVGSLGLYILSLLVFPVERIKLSRDECVSLER